MANEITELTQIETYGGPTLTLAGSSLAGLVVSLLSLQGSGTSLSWRIFNPLKADYLNTLKVITSGDKVLINAKAVPMNFTVLSTSAATPRTFLFPDIPAGSSATALQYWETRVATNELVYQAPVFKDASGATVTGGLTVSLDGGTALSYADFVTAVNALPTAEVRAGQHIARFSYYITTSVAGTLTLAY